MRKGLFLSVLTLLLVSGGVQSGVAQVTTGTIFGTVTDDSNAVIPGATVTVKNVETGLLRSLVSDAEGRYRAPSLPLGSYEVVAELPGFRTASRSGIVLTVGREAEVNFTLSVGELSETLSVTGEAPLVETTTAELSDLVDQRQIRELPLNSRSYTDLALLTPGVMTTSRNANFSGTSGGGVRLSISGARPTNTAYYIDGMDSKDAFGRTPGSAAGTTLGVDTIREFQVLVSNFSAQFGGSGGVLNAVTKSGTNAFHGSGFWFLRHSDLDAANFFDRLGVPPFRRDQAGFTFGGPIKRDRTFFFSSYEHLRQRRTTTTTINVPGPDLRAGITPTGVVQVHPLSKAFMDAMPLPNGIINSNGIGEYTTQTPSTADEDYFMVKVDQQLTQNDAFFARFTSDVAENVTPLAFPGFAVPAETTARFIIGEYNRIISPTLLNTARVSFNRSDAVLWNSSEGTDPRLVLIPLPGRVEPQLVVPGLSSFGNRGFDDRAWYLTSLQFSDKVTWTKGRHSLVAGMDFLGTKLEGFSASRLHGRIQFQGSVNNFLLGRPASWQFLVPGTGSDPAEGERGRSFHQNQFAFYVQDDFKVRSNLSLNLGLRWEFVDTPSEENDLISNLRDPMDRVETLGDPFFNPQKANFGPRLGVAWDPSDDGRMSIRGGFGVFYQPLNYATWQIAAVQNAPYFIRAAITNPSWPPPISFDLSNLPPGNPTPMEFNPDTPYYMHYNVSVQRQFLGDMVASVSYAGSRGRNLASTQNANPNVYEVRADGSKFWPVGAPRTNPSFDAVELRAFDLLSDYHSMQLRVNKRFSRGLQLAVAYTFGKNMDNGSETQGTALMDPSLPLLDYSLSDWDVRHKLTFNYIYAFPFFEDAAPAVSAILGGWQMSGLLTAETGNPLNVIIGFNHSRDGNVLSASGTNDRPNLKAGADPNPVVGDGRDPFRYADVSSYELQAAGTHGNLGRNALTGPGILTFDASFVKNIPFGGDRRLEVRMEFFNLLNRANFGNPNTSAFTNATGTPNPSFGRITSTSTTARQGQFALKFTF
jgi:outer membrane receptor protein involved in Fe transport